MIAICSRSALVVSLIVLATPELSGQDAPERRNILLIVADDVGVDQLASYGVGADLPYTPVLDALAQDGVQFRNAWSNPVCSTTRATILTGRYSFRTGMGYVPLRSFLISPEELFLPEALDREVTGYAHAAIGKWHLPANPLNEAAAPMTAGFDYYSGSLGNVVPPNTDYYQWKQTINGVTTATSGYLTTRTADDAAAWINGAPEPWFCYVAFNSAHAPFHTPPVGTFTVDLSQAGDPSVDPRPYYKAMIESLDYEMGRLFEAIRGQLGNTTIVFVGDNGTPTDVTVAPFLPSHAKGTIYQGGVNVPLIISGVDAVAKGVECNALVSTVDIFATVAELTGAKGAFNPSAFDLPNDSSDEASPLTASSGGPFDPTSWLPSSTEPKRPLLSPVPPPIVNIDGVSLVPYLVAPDQPSLRRVIFAELFRPNGFGPKTVCRLTIRNRRYKYLYNDPPTQTPELGPGVSGLPSTGAEEFYDLLADPFELNNLLDKPVLTEFESLAYADLKIQLATILSK